MGLKVQKKTTNVHKSSQEAITQHCMLLDQLREAANAATPTGTGPFIGNISRAAICNAGTMRVRSETLVEIQLVE